MADQQNPIQNNDLLAGTNLNGKDTEAANPTSSASIGAGDDTSATPVAPTNEASISDESTLPTPAVSDLGDVLVEKSVDDIQQKAEAVVEEEADEEPTEELATASPSVEIPAEPTISQAPTDLESISSIENAPMPTAPTISSPSYDPTNIDLGDISLAPTPEETMLKSPSDTSADAATEVSLSPEQITPSGMFSRASTDSDSTTPPLDIPAAPVEEVKAESSAETQPIENISLDVPAMDEPLSTSDAEPTSTPTETPAINTDSIDLSTPAAPVSETPTEEMPIVADIPPAPIVEPVEEETTPKTSDTDTIMDANNTDSSASPAEISMSPEKTDSLVDNLVTNESEKVAAMSDRAPAAPVSETPAEEMTLDLDSLTSDLTPQTSAETPAPAINESTDISAASPMPAAASVILPNPNLVQPAPHNTAKKKAFAMIAAFVMLLIVGVFVFRTMMPEESKALFAGILGSSEETPVVQNTDTAEIPTQINELISTGTADTGNNDTTVIEIPTTGNDTMSGMTDTGSTTEQPANTTPTITIDQAKNAVALISQQSKKDLAQALKEKNQ